MSPVGARKTLQVHNTVEHVMSDSNNKKTIGWIVGSDGMSCGSPVKKHSKTCALNNSFMHRADHTAPWLCETLRVVSSFCELFARLSPHSSRLAFPPLSAHLYPLPTGSIKTTTKFIYI